MTHYDDTTLALIALGETSVAADQAAHLSTCAQCRAEVAKLGAVVATARTIQGDDYPVAPPDAVWKRIVEEIHRDDVPPASSAPVADVLPVASQRPGRGRWAMSLAAAAVVGLLRGAGGTWTFARIATTPPPTQVGQVSVSILRGLDTPAATGQAVLRSDSAHMRTMTLTVEHLAAWPGAFYEVWLIDLAHNHLVALGVLGADGRGVYTLPVGLSLSEYSAIDVSLQPMNGSPEHSGKSAVRGTVTT